MAATIMVRDETVSGQSLGEWALEVTTERLTVRELIRSRVYQEVQDYNLRQGQTFHGLVQPEEAEQALNGWRLKKPRLLDWKRQYEKALDAFAKNQILILVNDLQVESLDEEVVLTPRTCVTFLRLALLVGG